MNQLATDSLLLMSHTPLTELKSFGIFHGCINTGEAQLNVVEYSFMLYEIVSL